MTTFKKVQSKVNYVQYSKAKAGDLLVEGVYISTESVPGYKGKGTTVLHKFLTDDHSIIALNSAGQLNHLMKSVPAGSLTRVTFLGKEKYKDKSGDIQEANQFEVEVAEDQDLLGEDEAESA